MKTPFPPQELHIQLLVAAMMTNTGVLDSSDTGCGKTLCSIQVARRMKYRPVIIAPKATLTAWARECADQGVEPFAIINYEKARTGKQEWCIKTPQGFKFLLPPGTMLIYDEVHVCKGFYTQNAKLLIASYQRPTLMLSATACEHPGDMRALGFVLRLHRMFDFFLWAKKMGCVDSGFGLDFDDKSPAGAVGLEHLNRLIYPFKGHRLTRDDLRAFFKNAQVIDDPINFADKEIAVRLAEVAAELDRLAEDEAGDRERGTNAEILVEILRARQRVEILKIPEIVEIIEQALLDHFSVPVFMCFNDTLEGIGRLLTEKGIKHAYIWGKETKSRDRVIDDFQCDNIRVLLINIAAGGTGVNLHHTETSKHPRYSIISPDFNAKRMHQVFGRTDRVNALSSAVIRVLIAAGTIEVKVMAKVRKKIDNLRRLHEKRPALSDIATSAEDMKTYELKNPAAPGGSEIIELPDESTPPEGAKLVSTETPPPGETDKSQLQMNMDRLRQRTAWGKDQGKGPVVDAAIETQQVEQLKDSALACTPGPVPAPVITTPDDPVMDDRPHAPYGPSKLEYISTCPGFENQQSDDDTNEAAESGTRCHNACETGDVSKLSDEELVLVEMAMGYVGPIMEKSIRIEQEIRVEVFDQWGYLDLLCFDSETHADLLDYKFGKIPVRDTETNLQMKCYTQGVFEKYPQLMTITVHIVQPRTDTISTHTWRRNEDLPVFSGEIYLILERKKMVDKLGLQHPDVFPLLQPFCSACDFCGNRWRCPALSAQVLTVAAKVGGLPIPDRLVIEAGEPITSAELGIIKRLADIAHKWASDMKDRAIEIALTQGVIPDGYTLQEANAPRQVPNIHLAHEVLSDPERTKEYVQLTKDDIYECAKGLSISALEDKFAAKAPKGKKTAWKVAMGNILQDGGAIASSGTYHKLVPIKAK
jgi:superfamily II DNA or RNA helicase